MNKEIYRVNPFLRFLQKDGFLRPFDYPIHKFPFYVDIELTNDCNLKYIMCKREIMTKISINWNGGITACCGDYKFKDNSI